jgi:hypothetical protein
MDTTGILEQLRLEKQVAERRMTDLNAAIEVLERLVNGHASTNGHAKKRKPGGAARIDWARARQMYENANTPVARIALALHCGEPTI